MTEISRRLSAGESDGLDPTLRSRILSSVTYTDAQADRLPQPGNRRMPPLMAVSGAAATGLLILILSAPVFFRAREQARSISPRAGAPSVAPVARPEKMADEGAANGAKAARQAASPPALAEPAESQKSAASGSVKPVDDYKQDRRSVITVTPDSGEQKVKVDSPERIISGSAGRTGQYFNGLPPAHRAPETSAAPQFQSDSANMRRVDAKGKTAKKAAPKVAAKRHAPVRIQSGSHAAASKSPGGRAK